MIPTCGTKRSVRYLRIFTPRSPNRENLVQPCEGQVACVLSPLPMDPGGGFCCSGIMKRS
jgi:hypothetical protein